MARKVPEHLRDKARKCIFCGEPGLSKTHIWPHWLHKLLSDTPLRQEWFDPAPDLPEYRMDVRVKQGAVFNQKPYLACVACNTGWMKDFEDEILEFARPLFTGSEPVNLEEDQVRKLAGWITLITILSEYLDQTKMTRVSTRSDLDHIWKHREPPPHWNIVAASLNGRLWRTAYRRYPQHISDFASREEYDTARKARSRPNNTQTTSFGMGTIFIQAFSSTVDRYVTDYRINAPRIGLIPLWPLHPGQIWPYVKQGTAKFPTNLLLTDANAEHLANSYANSIMKRIGYVP